MINLTDEERDRFVAYLNQEAECALGLAGVAPYEPLVKKLKTAAAAYEIVAALLSSGENMEIRG